MPTNLKNTLSNLKMWQLINILTNHCNNKKHVIEQVNVNDISYFNPKDIANQFGQYFSTIGNNMSSKIKQGHKQISDIFGRFQIITELFLWACSNKA